MLFRSRSALLHTAVRAASATSAAAIRTPAASQAATRIDRNGRKKAVLIDLKKHKGLWEDLFDAYVAHQRRGEPRESLAAVKRLVVARAKRKARG